MDVSDPRPAPLPEVPAVPADAYRAVMRGWPSGVTIVTMPGDEGPHGMTASAFTSVSVDPPMVLVVVDQRWRSHAHIAEHRVFCVNILAEGQAEWSDRFAGRHGALPDRFAGIATARGVTGVPHLVAASAWLDCQVVQAHRAGDHTIFVGRVVACGSGEASARPLLYYDGAYGRVEPLAGGTG